VVNIADVPIAFASIDPCLSCTARVVMLDREKEKLWVGSLDRLRRWRGWG